ncbi:unnamed protein product [Lampetra planeri]
MQAGVAIGAAPGQQRLVAVMAVDASDNSRASGIPDDAALGAFYSIPAGDRVTLAQALQQMAGIFNPPSNMCLKFAARRREEAETPPVFRSVLIALAQAAYPKMDKDVLDTLVLDRMLGLAQELDVVLPASDDDDLTSLRVARCLQAHLNIKRRSKVVACAGPAEDATVFEGVEAFASLNNSGWRKAEMGRRDDRDGRTGASSSPRSSSVVCFKCGLLGHISKGCRTDHGRTSRTPLSFG